MEYEIAFYKRGYFVITTGGATTPQDVEASLRRTFTRSEWKNGTSILYDNRQESLDKLSSKDVQLIAAKFTQFNDELAGSKIALVMPGDVAFGLARMWEAYTAGTATFRTNVFRSIEDAVQWIEE